MTDLSDRAATAGKPLEVLDRIRRSPPKRVPVPGERCEMCTEVLGDRHGHVVDVHARNLMCTCRGCYLLFAPGGAGGGHFKAVPERCLSLEVGLSPGQWEALQIPVSVAFFFVNSTLERVCAFYPGPAGATESLLSLDTWAELVETNPALGRLEPDVEAVLVRSEARSGGAPECYLVPIDWCYELVGELRQGWRGFDGGQEARAALEGFFAKVSSQARPAVASDG